MFTEGYSFPHPVLGNEDDISGELNVSFDINRTDGRKIIFKNVIVSITNQYINQTISQNIAKCYLKIYCSSTFSNWLFEIDKIIEIDEDELVNKIEIQLLIITKVEINNYYDNSFNKQYGEEIFMVGKNEIIGITGKVNINIPKINEKLNLGNIFKFHSQQSNMPVRFEFHHDKIFINYPMTKDGDHPPNLLFSTMPWIAFNIFIVPALSEALKYIKENIEEASQFEWFSVIDQLLPEDQRTEDTFADAQIILQKDLPLLLAISEYNKK